MAVYYDNSSKGQDKNLRRTRYFNHWRVDVRINGVRIRKRFLDKGEAERYHSLLIQEKEKCENKKEKYGFAKTKMDNEGKHLFSEIDN